jgi:serine/threonine protein kinase/dienelactone hydrolase
VTDAPSRLADALRDRYAIERELGHGGMATVHLARDLRYGRAVAIKLLRPDLSHAIAGERFLREVSIAAQLQSPHILPLLDSGEADGLLYYVMPYVDGESLRGRIASAGALAPSEALRLLRDVVDALAHAHRHGVVHRDIKPDNVMIVDRHALVLDFGVAKAMSDATEHHGLTSIGVSLGTPAYMAPEQAAADPAIDHRADIYSVGILAYEMLTGAPPFSGTPQAILAAQISTMPEPLRERCPDLSPAVAQIVERCLEKDPSRRPQSADDLLRSIESLLTPAGGIAPPLARPSRRRGVAIGAAAVVALATLGGVAFVGSAHLRRERWARGTAMPELRRLIDETKADSALELAMRIEEILPRDSTLIGLWPSFSSKVVVGSDPAGATVSRASLSDTSRWRALGVTPTDSIRLPIETGLFRYEKPGFRTLYRLGSSSYAVAISESKLVQAKSPDASMVRIGGGARRAFLVGSDAAESIQLREFRLDRFETTNRDFKRFVDAGGYRNPAYWDQPIVDDGRTVPLTAALARFVDRTGRPGPATWEGGGYPTGQGDYPVGGVSWYEAAAYAKFAGKSLPTIYHWATAASVGRSRYVVPLSNLEGSGPLPVGAERGVSAGGASDMAGNVREWCLNESGGGERFILGGGWTDPTYAFVDAYAQKPMDRSPINGIRLARYDAADANVALASRPIQRAVVDYKREASVSDAVFAGFRPQFDYDPVPLQAKVELRDSTAEEWITERVSFTTAYGERMSAWVHLPRRGTPPYQTVVFFPGSGAISAGPSTAAIEPRLSFIVRSGRIAVHPILKSTFERADSLVSDTPTRSIFWRDHVVIWTKDYRRTLDYLSTRTDVDTSRFAYFGYSWGGYMGGIIPAIEPRIKTSVLYVAGLTMERGRPEVDPLNFLPRIRTPVLMLNGKYDFFFPTETAQRPFYERIGTAAADKRYVVYEGGHDVPRTQLISETLGWLDRYLGKVR